MTPLPEGCLQTAIHRAAVDLRRSGRPALGVGLLSGLSDRGSAFHPAERHPWAAGSAGDPGRDPHRPAPRGTAPPADPVARAAGPPGTARATIRRGVSVRVRERGSDPLDPTGDGLADSRAWPRRRG